MNPLFAVRDALRTHGMATPSQLAVELALPRAVVDDVIAHWQRRGYAVPAALDSGACGTGCKGGGCGSCASGVQGEVFRWHDPAAPRQPAEAVLVRLDRGAAQPGARGGKER